MDDFTLLSFFNRNFVATRTLMVSSLDEEVNCALKKGGFDFEASFCGADLQGTSMVEISRYCVAER